MKLYNSNASPNALRSRAVIFELGLEPEIVNIDISKGENRTAEYLALNPNGKVPTLVDGELVVWESRAINAYLASRHPEAGLYPADPAARAAIDQWSYWQAIHLGPAMQRVAFERVQKKLFGRGEPDEGAITGELKTVAELLPVLEDALSGREWIAGTLSLADFALASTFMLRVPGRLGVEAFPNVSAWIGRLEARPSWQRAVTPMLDMLKARGLELG
ncbi:MAG TPA: glutathione S-transferase family protein [Devosia sp.]|nr:glutathione S-transferase family protein [Devosia sp.]